MRLIDADALKSVFTEKSTEAVCGAELCKAIISRIDDAPTVEAVPVIRCKDCKYAKCIEQNDDWWECSHDKRVMHGDGFCSWAENTKKVAK